MTNSRIITATIVPKADQTRATVLRLETIFRKSVTEATSVTKDITPIVVNVNSVDIIRLTEITDLVDIIALDPNPNELVVDGLQKLTINDNQGRVYGMHGAIYSDSKTT